MNKKLFPFVALLILASLILAACQPQQAAFVCDDELGCVDYAPGDPIRLASALVISGANAQLGLDSQYGVEIAMDFRGEVLGHPLELQA